MSECGIKKEEKEEAKCLIKNKMKQGDKKREMENTKNCYNFCRASN
jgi:hypothetical protein